MSDMIERDATLAAAQKAFGRVLTGSEKLLLDNVLEAIRAVPDCAAPAEDVRAGALKEAAALVMQTHRPPSIVKDFRDGYDVAKADIAGAILALIPGAKP